MSAYFNEYEPYPAQWLRNLIAKGLIPDGEVDTRSIIDVEPDDLRGFTQCHFFAGIGGWPLAARLAGWPDDRELWTGSCPCQPFSVAGQGKGQSDERHLWPVFFRLIAARAPAVVMGEQVAAAVGKDWLDGVFSNMEGVGYACGATVVPACAVDAPHRRDRLWFVADAGCGRRGEPSEGKIQFAGRTEALGTGYSSVAHADGDHGHWRSGPLQVGWNCIEGEVARSGGRHRAQWRTQPGLGLLADGVPARVGRLCAYGNAIVPQVAAEVIGAYMDCRP